MLTKKIKGKKGEKMKKIILLVSFLFVVSIISANQTSTYGWEDGVETVWGFYGNANFENSTEQAHSGTHSLKYWEDPVGGTPQGYIWWVTGLTDGDQITASFWVYDINDSLSYPKGRIWAHYTSDPLDIDSYSGSAGGNDAYSVGPGWSQLSWTWTFASSGDDDGIVIEARIYLATTPGPGENYIYIDDTQIEITSDTGTIYTLPVELSSFTALFANEFVTIQWATASETDVHGFNIYRAREDNFGDADKVNVDLIPGHGTTTQPKDYSFIDVTADAYFTTYYYWLEVVNYGGTTDIYGSIQYDPVDVDGDGQLNTVVHSFLNDIFPNPVQVGENITFDFMIGGLEGTMRPVSLNIYNIKGKLVKEVINEDMMVNDYTKTWRVNDIANGVYFYQLKTENYQETKKLLIQ